MGNVARPAGRNAGASQGAAPRRGCAARCQAPVAASAGSVPKPKGRRRALQGGSVDPNTRFGGNGRTTEASSQSMLKTPMKKRRGLWCVARPGKPPYPSALAPLFGCKAGVWNLGTGNGGHHSHLAHGALTQDPREREVSSTAPRNTPGQDKGKTEHLVASQRGLADCSDPKESVVSLSTSQMFLPSKPLPPIQNSPPSLESSKMCNREQEHGENGPGYDDSEGNNKELITEERECQASLLPVHCSGGDMKKGPLGPSLIPPIPKSVSPPLGSAAVSLPSSQHQEAQDMRLRSISRNEEKNSKYLASSQSIPKKQMKRTTDSWCGEGPEKPPHPSTLVPPFGCKAGVWNLGTGNGGHRSHLAHGALTQDPREREVNSTAPRSTPGQDKGKTEHLVASQRGLPLRQTKDMDHLMSPHFTNDDDLKDSSGRVRVVLCKSAEKKIQQRKMREMELLEKEREKEKSLQLPTLRVDPRNAAEESFSLPPVNGTLFNVHRKPAAALKTRILKKQINVPLMPKTPNINVDGSFPHNFSVNSQMAIGLERREEPGCGNAQKGRPSSDPQQLLLSALTWLSSDNWELKEKGLLSIKCLAISHSKVLLCRLREVSLAVTKEVTSLRSKVSHSAIVALGELFVTLKKDMDSEVDEVAQVLLQMVWNSPEFIQKAASQTLGVMVENVTPSRAMTALMDSGVQHRHVLVRKCAAKHLLTVMEKIGAKKLAATPVRAERLVRLAVKLAQDCHKDTRYYGWKMLHMLMSHQKFNRLLEQSVSTRDLKDILARIKNKGIEDHEGEPPPVENPRKRRNNGLMPQARMPSCGGLESTSDVPFLHRSKVHLMLLPTVEETELLQKLYDLLTAKEFQIRMEGVALLLDLCKSSPRLISNNIVQIFDYFVLRICDYNKKVKQQALEALALMIAMLRDALNPVLIRLVEAITNNLNSKHLGIYGAAVKALEASIAHLDKVSVLKEFSNRMSQLSGQALLDVTERLSVLVARVYPRSPEVVQRYALPVLWSFLGNKVPPVRSANVRTVVAKLAKALHDAMGSKLRQHAASQPQNVVKNLSNILGWNVR
ncbi:TOG array regulator of axonemal microtubules protein 2 [Chiroxiphia lanceolata]|uniref:TOG array regulator of axonemal microtubules protein 2 n=1 Tax=Chiroxiphia lanceolata TaxID=296741 RepID=UPI0013CED708|nr:TOG array regulator of axonemal microtubules protein 2 [Chiroxiphia lanceolata]